MNAFLPSDTVVLMSSVVLLAAVITLGYLVTGISHRRLARLLGWLMTSAAIAASHGICVEEAAGYRMVSLILTLLCGMKVVVAVEAQGAKTPRLEFLPWLVFCVGWLGMRIETFSGLCKGRRDDWFVYVKKGSLRLVVGLVFLLLACAVSRLSTDSMSLPIKKITVTLLMFVGFSLAVHFGIINLMAGCWRRAGADCRSMFRAPLASYSLREFWGRRWNIGFSEMTALGVYRPLRAPLGTQGATFIAFVFSGILHELAITVPVMQSFGLPLCYFALHGCAMQAETQWERRGGVFRDHPLLARIWTTGWLVLPLPILFPDPFLREVLWPMIEWYPV
jgi:alginate O-acetyltransferase complex protein AlgI|tara:strand:+ start:1377 stop:2381 length:1005 start_codon:yes stop_codon:yes gene_type:complete